MKKLNFLYGVLFTIVFFSCKDDEDPTYKKEDFVGTWERTSTTVEDDCDVSTEILVITNTQVISTSTCDGDEFESELNYTFDNKKTLTVEFFPDVTGKFVIRELTDTQLKIDGYLLGQKTGTSTYTKN